MPKTVHRILLTALLPALLSGCDALYDDTKGWARRLETSLLDAADGKAAPAADEAAAPAAAQPAEMPAPPAVPVEPVTAMALAAPTPTPAPAPASAPEAPEGAMAEASAALLSGSAADPKATPEETAPAAAAPALPKPKPAQEPVAAQAADDALIAVMLHLSSLRSEEAAKRQWSDLQQSFPEPLAQLQAEFRRTDLGEQGTFYRVLAGPLPSHDAAAAVCAALKAKSAEQYCRILPRKSNAKPKA